MTRLAAILTFLALAGCAPAPAAKSQVVDLGAEVTLAPGETTTVNSAEFRVRFVAVTEDSRCPRDVTCIWAGEVKVLIEVQSMEGASRAEVLEGGSTVAGRHRVTFVRVEPQPMSAAKIAPQDYRATLKIEKGS